MVTMPTIFLVTDRGRTSQIDHYFWENFTRVMGRGMGAMLQANIANSNPLPPLVHRWYAGISTVIGHWQSWWGMPRSTQKLASQEFGGIFKCPRNVLTTVNNYWQI